VQDRISHLLVKTTVKQLENQPLLLYNLYSGYACGKGIKFGVPKRLEERRDDALLPVHSRIWFFFGFFTAGRNGGCGYNPA
jgi:hypothetical protein